MGKVDSIQIPIFEADGPDYQADFCAWSEEQGRRLRLLRIPGVDTASIAEEIEGWARSDRNQLESRVKVLLTHLLKWRYQPSHAGNSWRLTIREQRQSVAKLLKASPSLRAAVPEAIAEEYGIAMARAAHETKLDEAIFPSVCEWTVDEVLAADFLPEPRI